MQELKPCPFCDSSKAFHNTYEADFGIAHEIVCDLCGCNVTYYESLKDCILRWNTRPIEDALRAEIAKLQDDNRSLVEQINHFSGVKNMVPEPPEKGE